MPAPRRIKTPPLTDLVSLDEAMALTGCSRRTMYRLAAEGKLTVFKVGTRNNRYSRTELQSLVAAGRSMPEAVQR